MDMNARKFRIISFSETAEKRALLFAPVTLLVMPYTCTKNGSNRLQLEDFKENWEAMDLEELKCKNGRGSAEQDIWGYVKSQGERYAFDTVQRDATSGEKLSFNELSKNIEALGLVLRKLNLPLGIGICSENNLDYSWILLGALSAGIRCTLLSPTYTARELRHFLELTKPGLVLCSKMISELFYENGESFGAVCSEYPFIRRIYVWGNDGIDGKISPYESLSSLLHDQDLAPIEKRGDRIFHGDREALILASSGSTGLPKGVVLTHRAIVETLKLSHVFARIRETALGLMPFSHAYGLILGLMCLCEGSELVIVPKLLNLKYLSDVIAEYEIRNLYVVPSLLATIGKSQTFTKERLSCLRHVWTSAGRVSRNVQERAMAMMPSNAVLHHAYGMTETTFITLTSPCVKTESPGKLVPNIECKIMQGEKVCGPDEVGELWFKGPTIMKGYLNNEKATRETLRSDGWLMTGDLGYYDQDGYFFIVDRIKEMIKYQGNQVSPLELEGIILELSDVLEAGVVGLPDEDFGELPAAGIVVKQNSKLTEEEVKDHVASMPLKLS